MKQSSFLGRLRSPALSLALFFRVYRAIRSFSEQSVKQSSFLGRSFRVYRAIHSFSEQSVKLSSLLRRLRSLALFLDNTYTLAFRS